MLHITASQIDDKVVLQCHGRIVRGDETALLCAAIRHEERDLTLDLTNVESIDAAGIGALISLRAAGIYLRLLNPSKPVREMLRITELDTILEICDSRQPAIGQTEVVAASPMVADSPTPVTPALAFTAT